jgi:hypothetical protein
MLWKDDNGSTLPLTAFPLETTLGYCQVRFPGLRLLDIQEICGRASADRPNIFLLIHIQPLFN